ncbi:type II secretion system protein [Cuneatibacter caecimuris]|uniref:Prepilin-type N-terminal cleavage/methylation domain-containing protein n=1 Tax=Cuneatibacter caecimuris TaxID=1796618 RepID=A0A4Q7PP79_9FIRM|nr:prepilin-type N-terminal cleavage/methylation domain-containing protein [Cuneatibacter caecimuris]RZT02295.1 prepilin-type N-terminal cleavage/methylation domain-containing protein [Cuneatibacter caecimuris]
MLKKVRKDKKGFTLVELIVVLVILAILAAILVPALLGWIDKAKEKQVVINGRTVYMAAQTIASEKYASTAIADGELTLNNTITAGTEGEIVSLAGVDGTWSAKVTIAKSKVTKVEYTESGITATYDGKTWTTQKATATP